MSDDSNPVTSSAPAGSEPVDTVSDAPEVKQSTDTNGTKASDTVPESSKEVAPEVIAPVESMLIFCFPLFFPVC
jgi:hypothetical protein